MNKLKQLKNQYFQDSLQKDKQIFFLGAMNQNPDIACTGNSMNKRKIWTH